jgi:hypothetical protein
MGWKSVAKRSEVPAPRSKRTTPFSSAPAVLRSVAKAKAPATASPP